MYRILAIALLMAVLSGCSDSPGTPGGTLPVVQNCRIVPEECRGDTVTVAWDPVTVDVDGYRVWFSTTSPGSWQIVAQVEGAATAHIAASTGYYCVEAIKGIDTSEALSNKANDRADMFLLDDTLSVWGQNGIRFLPTHVELGSASDPSFHQDLYIGWEGDAILFYRGNYDPESFPGGRYSSISTASNTLAPGPGDAAWKSVIAAQEGARYFVALENGHYALFWIDTLFDSMVILNSSQYQGIHGLRLFNPFVF